MHRRDFLKLMLSMPIAATVDVEQLLWTPGEKTIFLPPALPIGGYISESAIIEAELDRIGPFVKSLFNRDDIFYKILEKGRADLAPLREFTVPFERL